MKNLKDWCVCELSSYSKNPYNSVAKRPYIESYKKSKTESSLAQLKLKYQVEIMDQQQELLKTFKKQIADKEKELISMRKMYHETSQKYLKQRDSYRIAFAT
jgi:hypothetical protein